MTPPDGPRSLAGDADRERLVSLLREHYAMGRIDIDEFSRRVGLVLAAEDTDQAAVAVADLPPLDLARPGRPRAGRAGGRRHAQVAEPGPGWVPTQERFRDPASGKITRVWIDPADQSRHYVPEPDA